MTDRFDRVVLVVLDGVGIGAAPDAAQWGDADASSVANVAAAVGGLRLPVLSSFGLGHIADARGVTVEGCARAHYGKMTPAAAGKDSTAGHWELMGCVLRDPFPVYPDGFPAALVREIESRSGYRMIGNCAASGTEIIERLGREHLQSHALILYTSRDSVFQVAAHEDAITTRGLYDVCAVARELLVAPNNVARVIARPFRGEPGAFYRTSARRDFSVSAPKPTVIDALAGAGRRVHTIGKIDELFPGATIHRVEHTRDNTDGMRRLLDAVGGSDADFIFVNLVDFDTMWGHRNDARAYALGLEEFDGFAGELTRCLRPRDLLIITADHGNDPTTASTDHSREFVPLLVWHSGIEEGVSLGTRATLADAGATVCDIFGIREPVAGESFAPLI